MNSNLNKPISLRAIVAELLSSYNRVHPERASFIINSVSEDIFTYQRKNWLVHLLGDLYKLLGPLSKDEPVRIAARIVNGDIRLYLAKEEKKKEGLLVRLYTRFSPTVEMLPIHYYFSSIA